MGKDAQCIHLALLLFAIVLVLRHVLHVIHTGAYQHLLHALGNALVSRSRPGTLCSILNFLHAAFLVNLPYAVQHEQCPHQFLGTLHQVAQVGRRLQHLAVARLNLRVLQNPCVGNALHLHSVVG